MADAPDWSCPGCTLENSPTLQACRVCATARPSQWVCVVCSLENSGAADSCTVCDFPRVYDDLIDTRSTAAARPPAASPHLTPMAGLSPAIAAAAVAAAVPPSPTPTWTCSSCTYENQAGLVACSVCDTATSMAALPAVPAAGRPVSVLPQRSFGCDDGRVVYCGPGDGPSVREEARGKDHHQAVLHSTGGPIADLFAEAMRSAHEHAGTAGTLRAGAGDGPGAAAAYTAFVDPDFLADDSSLGAEAEVTMSFRGEARKLAVPVLWRPPHNLADENGNYGPDATLDPVAELAAYHLRSLPSHDPAAAAAGAGAGGSGAPAKDKGSAKPKFYRPPPPADSAHLLEQLRRKLRCPAASARGAAVAPPTLPKGGPPWVFKRGRYQCEDVAQGQLGVCWFVSALSLVAQREELIGRLFPAGPLLDALRAAGEPVPPAAAAAVEAGDHAAAAAALAAETIPLHPRNLYQVRLCVDGLWRVVTVDGRIPAHSYLGGVAYTRSLRRQAWIPIIEKAAAKVVGSYGGLAGGHISEGLRLLTGAPVLSLCVRTDETLEQRDERHLEEWRTAKKERGKASAGEHAAAVAVAGVSMPWEYGDVGAPPPVHVLDGLWGRLLSWLDAGYLMGASCALPESHNHRVERIVPDAAIWAALMDAHTTKARGLGLFPNHAYALLDVQADTAGSAVRLVKIRNPHAAVTERKPGGPPNTWTGAWCDASAEWAAHPGLCAVCGPHFQEDTGVFWMSLQDFASYFDRIDVAKVPRALVTAAPAAPAPVPVVGAIGGAGAGVAVGISGARAMPGPLPETHSVSFPSRSVVRARLPLPSAQHGVYSLRVVPQAPDGAATEVDVVVTDLPNAPGVPVAAAGIGTYASLSSPRGDVRYRRRRTGDAKPPHDLAALVVEELSRGAAAALAAARWAEADVRRVGTAAAAGAAVSIARVDSHGQPSGPKDPRAEALAIDASGMRYVTGGKRRMAWEVSASAYLDGRPLLPPKGPAGTGAGAAPRAAAAGPLESLVYHVLPFSLNSYAQASDASGSGLSFAIVELHHATNRPLKVEVVHHPPSLGSSFFARAVMCRTLTLGSPNSDPHYEEARPGGDGRYCGRVIVAHSDGAGEIVVAANRLKGATQAFSVRQAFAASTEWKSLVVSRPAGSAPAGGAGTAAAAASAAGGSHAHVTEDFIEPLSAQVLQTLSYRPLAEGCSNWSWDRVITTSGAVRGTKPAHAPPISVAAAGGGALHVQLPFAFS